MATTDVYDAFWRFAAERQRIYIQRHAGSPPPWTADPLLTHFRFTNAYRAADRTSQYLIREVIYGRPQDTPQDTILATIAFKLFNSVPTWEALTRHTDVSPAAIASNDIITVLSGIARSQPMYSSAYIIPPVDRSSDRPKYEQHVHLLRHILDTDVPSRVLSAKGLEEIYLILRQVRSFGPFIAFQIAIDINYGASFCFDENDFIVAGPGAREGIFRCFGSYDKPESIIRSVTERQTEEFERRGLTFTTLWGRDLHLIDVQNLFCEIAKYARVAFPTADHSGHRSRIKRRYRADGRLLPVPFFPPSWGINNPALQALGSSSTGQETAA